MAAKIAPPKTSRAVQDRSVLRKRSQQKIREQGYPINIAKFIAELHEEGVTERPGKKGLRFCDTTIRRELRKLNVTGARGRKRNE